MVGLTFSLEGGEVISRQLNIAADGVKDFRTPLNWIAADLMKTFDMNFQSRGALYGGWEPRKPQFRKGIRVDTWPLMEKTGRMRRNFFADATKTRLTVDNKTWYFPYHQSAALPRDVLPRRVMMKLRQQDATMIVKHFQSYLITILRQRGER